MANRRALVCGASQGIGAATAAVLSQAGVSVTLFARSEDKLNQSLSQLSGEGHDLLTGDIGDPSTWQSELEKRHREKPYDILVLNSGGPKGGPISQAKPEEFAQAMNNHLVANSIMVRLFLDHWKEQNWGRVLTVTSTSVKIPIPHLGVSNTARAAVASWGKTLSLELAPFGVTVNNVMPGFTDTPRLHSLIEAKAASLGKSVDEVSQMWQDMVPMKRFAKPEETASLIGFLCGDSANYITGQSIAVDGGRLGCL